ncbi:MAG TPA: hypothetical protein VFK59_03240 [Actinomycetota bacterium]|jgi:hypothetical protein|nr:hypothetical protein [Actinomycetota bacterium]
MGVLRLLFAMFLILHGLGHAIWFMGAWVPVGETRFREPWLFSEGVTIESPAGKVIGLLALVTTVGFVAAGWGLLGREDWWRATAIASAVLSLIVVVPWWRSSPGTTSINATLADVAILLVALLPIGQELAEAG